MDNIHHLTAHHFRYELRQEKCSAVNLERATRGVHRQSRHNHFTGRRLALSTFLFVRQNAAAFWPEVPRQQPLTQTLSLSLTLFNTPMIP